MAECLQEHIAHIAHTREGARAAMYVVWYSSAKGRKAIIKQIKPYLEKLLTEEYGHLLLFSIFDAVDDTKLVSKVSGWMVEASPQACCRCGPDLLPNDSGITADLILLGLIKMNYSKPLASQFGVALLKTPM